MNKYSASIALGLASITFSLPALGMVVWSSTRVICNDQTYRGVKLTVDQLDKLIAPIRSNEKMLILCGVDLSGTELGDRKLNNINFTGANFRGAKFNGADLANSNFSNADLSDSDIYEVKFDKSLVIAAVFDRSQLFRVSFKATELNGSSFKEARLFVANFDQSLLEQVSFDSANVQQATFRGANAADSEWPRADISLGDFGGANLRRADFEAATIRESDFSGANMNGVSLKSASFDPSPGGLPSSASLGGLTIDKYSHYETSPLGLVAIRAAMKEAGRDEDVRRLTYGIEHQRTREFIRGTWSDVVLGYFRLVMFEWTTGYGLVPGRSLLILLGLIPTFGLVYWFAIVAASTTTIWIVPAKDDVSNEHGLDAYPLKKQGLGTVARALQFSLLSAFQVGWRDLNVGSWLSRLQSHNYSFSARGWVRSVSGFQSLVSVYLLAIWVLTFFGKPFE